MAYLTEAQTVILRWIVESRVETVMFEEVYGPRQTLTGTGGAELEVIPSDVRELEHQGLIRWAGGHGYELTNEGRVAYEQITAPPPAPKRRAGFLSG